ASGADLVIDQARVYATPADAVADLNLVVATTARSRDMTKRVLTPRRAAEEIRHIFAESGARTGILFGREAKGLTNDEVALADAILNVPLNPAFSSLNLAQAVLLVGYEWRLLGLDVADEELAMPKTTRPADHQDLVHLFEHLESELETCGFLQPAERAPTMVRNLRNLFGRARLTDQEVRILRGVIVALRRGPRDPASQD
ncbi:MAG: TrmH family RNA methyltransferase, partial [Alphaproteobacteria bacterium]